MQTRRPVPTLMRPRPALSPVLLLVVALLWAQLLGVAHRVLHAPQTGAVAAAHGHEVRPILGAGLLAHMVAPANDAPECRLYDQLGLADTLLAVPALALPLAAPLLPCRAVVQRLLVSGSAPFQARAPPSVR